MPENESENKTKEEAFNLHHVLAHSIHPPFADHYSKAMFGMGCFWGAEKKFWELEGVYVTAVGYAAGHTKKPTYKDVCSGETGHNEVVLVVFDEKIISYLQLLKCFWESHNPTQGMRQGNDVGTQYRSGVYAFNDDQLSVAKKSLDTFQQVITQHLNTLAQKDKSYTPEVISAVKITTEILTAPRLYYAENYHQQYLAKNTDGYCGLGGTGLMFPSIE